MLQSVAVFCGSQNGNNPIYIQHAETLGKLLAENKIDIVYGGGNSGLMGAVANAALENAGKIIGIIPKRLVDRERAHKSLTQIHIVDDMHTRKQMMYSLSEAILILPGGNGTLDEMFETITWNVLSIHDKKVILLNSAGFYNALVQHIENMFNEGFLYSENKIEICSTPEEVLQLLTKD
ncbi:Rossman fold protein, TIGR00730 family [Arachidicoccus ginsenosidimutans]|uniref:LOG family protein n=1 Tax=Arachidicoccus sp. BS20 TaxID=1850526 RepID=UPI0007F0A28E|nr:TIGR00730 family Rossman fold protein [Arachidicoccus sp. BS20]ANI89465.1 Rossman fold protein, TIGR00730 family [Arachidicoccus sp. BS20]